MRKSDRFTAPRRQSQWAIVFIVLGFLKKLLNQLWPIVIALFLGRSTGFSRYELIFSGLGIFGMLASVVAYFRYYYFVSDKELIIRSGLFKRVKLNIPFERIQSVNFKQTVLHRIFQVTEVEIETAGSSKQESRLDALSIDDAEALRSLLLEKRAAALSHLYPSEVEAEPVESAQYTILRLSIRQLIKVGLTQNHFAPIGLLSGIVFSSLFYAMTFDIDVEEILRSVWTYGERLAVEEYALLLLGVFLISVLLSILRTLLRHYDLHFWRTGKKFQVVQGLFTRREFAALDSKIQILNWGQNPLERWIGFYNIMFRQARSGSVKAGRMMFKIPGCNLRQVAYVQDNWLGAKLKPIEKYHKVSIHYFLHAAIYQVLFILLVSAAMVYMDRLDTVPFILLLGVSMMSIRWIKYQKLKYGTNGTELYIGGGVIGLRHVLLPIYKIQNISIAQNPYQWRRGLGTLLVDTAAGRVTIPYVDQTVLVRLIDQLIYRVEVSHKDWM